MRIELGIQPAWMANGLCREIDPDLFFPEPGDEAPYAKAVCRACDVETECLAYAMNDLTLQGIWGATSPRMRIRLSAVRRHSHANR